MKYTDPKGFIHQVMHAVFDGKTQLTKWRTCKVAAMGALHRSGHKAKKPAPLRNKLGVIVHTFPSGPTRVRDRNYSGLTMKSKVFITPPREKAAA